MGLKELTVKESLLMLAEKYPEPVKVKSPSGSDAFLFAVTFENKFTIRGKNTLHFDVDEVFIETPDEYRYMTQQECLDWVCLYGYKGYQIRVSGDKEWFHPSWSGYLEPEYHLYRTIQEIGGKIVYGQPQEFKIKVEL